MTTSPKRRFNLAKDDGGRYVAFCCHGRRYQPVREFQRRGILEPPRGPERVDGGGSDSTKVDQQNETKRAENTHGLPSLNRPLGVRDRPTTVIKTRTQKMKDLMDQDVRMAQRRHLIKEAGKGYFHDMNMTRKHGGKTWIAPKVLIREDKALYLPNIVVLAMLGTKISEVHAKGFVDPTHSRFSSNPLYQYVQINLQENLLKSFLVNLFTNSLRRIVPPALQPTYLVSSQNMEYVREPLGMTNSKVGYVYLVDENLKVRWGGCADALLEETQALENCTGVLLKRLEKRPGKRGDVQSDAEHETPTPTLTS
ncbi:ATP10 protein-domain-containing protein [Infundibulicybe gibba]|nr:ATP10 protein-domain-containing protein [Infundibulicybe gibba]